MQPGEHRFSISHRVGSSAYGSCWDLSKRQPYVTIHVHCRPGDLIVSLRLPISLGIVSNLLVRDLIDVMVKVRNFKSRSEIKLGTAVPAISASGRGQWVDSKPRGNDGGE